MRRSVIGGGLVLFAVGVLSLTAPAGAQAQALGRLYVEALDAAGQAVPGLTASDFVVLEDETRVNVVSVEPVGPMKLALLVDNGDRMSQLNALNPLQEALGAFFDTLGPEHEVAVFTIARNLRRQVGFTTDREALKVSAGEIFLDPGAGTLLLDGVRETWERHYDGDETLPVMVLLLTDGPENSRNYSDRAYADFVETLVVAGVLVNVLQLSGGSRGDSARGSVTRGYARNVADNTGGVYETFSAVTGMAEWMRRYAERLNAHHADVSKRYRVLYEPPEPRGARISAGARPGVGIRLFADLRMVE